MSPRDPLAARRRAYLAMMATALLLLVVAWLVLGAGPVAIALSVVAALLVPLAVIVANSGR